MNIAVIINNYNYASYLIEALESVVKQTCRAHEIIVVDDGSTDNSVELLREFKQKHANCTVIEQKNQGQLQTMINGCKVSTSDVVCFLDSDDMYMENHLEAVKETFSKDPSLGMRFSPARKFGEEDTEEHHVPYFGNLGITALYTYLTGAFLGNVTSTVSISSKALLTILPHLEKHAPKWITRADNCFIWAVSLAGYTKENVDQITVRYRVHQSNRFCGREEAPIENIMYEINKEFFLSKFSEDIGLLPTAVWWLYKEIQTSNISHEHRLKRYKNSIYSHRNPYVGKARDAQKRKILRILLQMEKTILSKSDQRHLRKKKRPALLNKFCDWVKL